MGILKRAADLRLGYLSDEHWELGIICGTGGLQAKAYCNEDKTKIEKDINVFQIYYKWKLILFLMVAMMKMHIL